MSVISVVGIDLAKTVFHVHGVDESGRVTLRKKLRRAELIRLVANSPKCLIGIEACSGSHYWAREFSRFGHTVKLMPPQYVKPYVKTNKNDFNDAEAICEAVQRPNMRFVPSKSVEQLQIQMLHRIRQRLIRARTALANEIRGHLNEYGVVIPKGISHIHRRLALILSDGSNGLSEFARRHIERLGSEFRETEERIKVLDCELMNVFKQSEVCLRLATIPGVGPITATALIAAIADPANFKGGRQLAAWLGLVPRQHSTGGKAKLLGISKRGDTYLRTLLIHGARAVVHYAKNKSDRRSQWICEKQKTRGSNRTTVAVANKNARIVWRMLMSGESYRTAA